MSDSVVFRVWRDSGRQFSSVRTKKDFTSKPEAVAFAAKQPDRNPSIEKITTEQVTGWEDSGRTVTLEEQQWPDISEAYKRRFPMQADWSPERQTTAKAKDHQFAAFYIELREMGFTVAREVRDDRAKA